MKANGCRDVILQLKQDTIPNDELESRWARIINCFAADGTAEADTARLRRKRHRARITLGADKAYDQKELVQTLGELGMVPRGAEQQTPLARRSI